MVEGVVRGHRLFGPQLHAQSCLPVVPRGRLLIRYLTHNHAFAGLGPKRAQRLWERFGDGLAEAMSSGKVAELAEVLSATLAHRVVEAWGASCRLRELVNRLDALGFDPRLALRLMRIWGERSAEMLERNPYFMLAFSTWASVDTAARRLEVALDDPRRQIGAIESVLYDRLLDGHTVTADSELRRLVSKRISPVLVEAALSLASKAGALAGSKEDGWQPVGAALLEHRVETMLRNLVRSTERQHSRVVHQSWLNRELANAERAWGIALNSEQIAAVQMALSSPVCLLLGGAGVGKTAVLGVVGMLAQGLGLKTVQVAVAGRAAKRLAESTGFPAMTIAKLLHLMKGNERPLPAEGILVVDEASMLDLPTTYRLLRQMPEGVRLLLVGDPAQLPPIGFGLVFHRLADSAAIPSTTLVQVLRQQAHTGIPLAASAIRHHRIPAIPAFDGSNCGVSFDECGAKEVLPRLMSLARLWAGGDWRIICATKSGINGVDAINDALHRANPNAIQGQRFAVGDPVIHLQNDYERGLMNGSLGYVIHINSGDDVLSVDFDGKKVLFEIAEGEHKLDLAYAITCHKAQGSQFERIAVVIVSSRLLEHSLVYIAVTRGVQQVVLIGSRDAFKRAVEGNSCAQLRKVGFWKCSDSPQWGYPESPASP